MRTRRSGGLSLAELHAEPAIRVGLVASAPTVRFELSGLHTTSDGTPLPDGSYLALSESGSLRLDGPVRITTPSLVLRPACAENRITVHDVVIGIDFHWQRKESQTFEGALEITAAPNGLRVVNELPLEAYLASVISSEMSASCPAELLRAHAVVSRSWLLAQLARPLGPVTDAASTSTPSEIIRWYGREAHDGFDVCADDHCQRYQGIGKAFSGAARDSVAATRGLALIAGGDVCDTRYSKCCGGVTEVFSTAWDDRDVPYLASIFDGAGEPQDLVLPLTSNCNAGRFIDSDPPAYCNTRSRDLLERILPGFDQATTDFYRWTVEYSPDELGEIVESRLGLGLGPIVKLEPLERGSSGRIKRLRIVGQTRSIVIGKELEIRRALSRSHLYSSAFIVRSVGDSTGKVERIRLSGAGWGHGVGLCQIGAAVMADLGRAHADILAHYFRDAKLERLY